MGLQAVILAGPHLTGSMKLAEAICLLSAPTFLSAPRPSCVLLEAFPFKVQSGLVAMLIKRGRRDTEKFLLSYPSYPNLSRRGLELVLQI